MLIYKKHKTKVPLSAKKSYDTYAINDGIRVCRIKYFNTYIEANNISDLDKNLQKKIENYNETPRLILGNKSPQKLHYSNHSEITIALADKTRIDYTYNSVYINLLKKDPEKAEMYKSYLTNFNNVNKVFKFFNINSNKNELEPNKITLPRAPRDIISFKDLK